MKSLFSERWLVGVLALVAVTRVPFLFFGYGGDADSWLVANSAATLWNTGTYYPSRLPGYPLHEILSAPLVGLGGSILSNGATVLVTLATVVVWWQVARRHARHSRLIVVCLAFAPVVWQHSAETIDYLWSLFFILVSWRLIERGRPVLSGVVLGIAIGFRPSNVVALIPLLVASTAENHRRQEQLKTCVALCLTTFVTFLPLMWHYGVIGWVEATLLQMDDVLPQTISARLMAFGYRSIYFIGPVTAIFSTATLVRARHSIVRSSVEREPLVLSSIVGMVAFLTLFYSLPVERAYLLPALPFFLLLMDRFSSRYQFTLFTALLICSGLINVDVIARDNRRAPGLNVRWGMVIEELQIRRDLLEARRRIASLPLPDNSIVMTSHGPTLWRDNDLLEPSPRESALLDGSVPGFEGHRKLYQKKGNPTILFTMYLTSLELEQARRAHLTVFCLQSTQNYVESQTRYSMQSAGVTVIADR